MTVRGYEPVEEELVSAYIAQRLAGQHTFVHLRLGQPLPFSKANPAPDDVRRLHLPELPEADLVTRTLDRATVYEFAVWRPLTKAGQLLRYKERLPDTPGFLDLDSDHVDLILVGPQLDPDTDAFTKKYGITFQYFSTPDVTKKVADRRGTP